MAKLQSEVIEQLFAEYLRTQQLPWRRSNLLFLAMVIGQYLNPKNNFAFYRIFGQERNKAILIAFLNDVLDHTHVGTIREVSLLRNHQNPAVAGYKESIVDVLCIDQAGVQYIVEMQVAQRDGFVKRAQYYAAKAYSSQARKGQQYADLKEVIFLAITDFVMFPQKKAYKSSHVILDRKSYEHDLKDFSFTFIELPKFKKCLHELETMEEKWCFFFKEADRINSDEWKALLDHNPIIQAAYKELEAFNLTDDEKISYDKFEKYRMDLANDLAAAEAKGIERGKKEGFTKGKEEGKYQEKIAIARKMLELGLADRDVVASTGLQEREIVALKKVVD